jgi:site-specific DNA-methyltransferase (adenine-specific)
MNRALFSAQTGKWATPKELYAELDREFHFTLDPCPMDDAERIMEQDGLARSWANDIVFCNPPYGAGIWRWLDKAKEAPRAVYLLPARTDTVWFHDYALHADEIRFIRGRLKFGDAKNSAPFPSMLVIFNNCLHT